MKVTGSLVLTVAVGSHASSIRKARRSLQNNQYNQQQYYNNQNYQNQNYQGQNGGQQGNGQYGGQQQYENFEEYMQYLMASRTFTFTGCSTVQSNNQYYGSLSYVTYRLCGDGCSDNSQYGCDNSNGDYVVSMQEFAETYAEYREEVTGQDGGSPFECVR